jgi:hypothetical protein
MFPVKHQGNSVEGPLSLDQRFTDGEDVLVRPPSQEDG